MQRSLHEHILFLEEKIQELREQLTSRVLAEPDRDRIQDELRVAEASLAHYRAAHALEQELG